MIGDSNTFIQDEAQMAIRTLEALSKKSPPAYPLGQINPKPLKACRGIFFYHAEKMGLGLGVKWGRGWLLMRTGMNPPKWSPPVFYKVLEGSIGFTAGKGGTATLIALGTDDAVDSFVSGHAALGSDLTLNLGSGDTEAECNNAFDRTWKESRAWTLGTDGILADVSLTGGRISVHDEANHAVYGPAATPTTIIVAGDASKQAAGFQVVYDVLASIISRADSDPRKFSGFDKHCSATQAFQGSSKDGRHLATGSAAPGTPENPRDSMGDRTPPQPADTGDDGAAGQQGDGEETKGLLWGTKGHAHQA